jgi:hypothetical protein
MGNETLQTGNKQKMRVKRVLKTAGEKGFKNSGCKGF